jgi:glyoxylase-like metal-dependent hydrolase (beta-lactamase superfamily II)
VSQAVNKSNTSKSSITTTVQIPDAAKGSAIPAKGYLVQEICDDLYWVTDGSYNAMFLVTDKGLVAVDAPPSIGKNYLKAIAEVTDKPVTYVIYSHAHLDHIGAAGIFPKNATFIAQQETAGVTKSKKCSQKCFHGAINTYSHFFQELYIADWKSNPKVRLLRR